MTFEQLLIKYLYQHKKISLQGFGTVVLNATIPEYDLIHKNKQLPIEGLSFEYDQKAGTDEEFILYFAQQRGKIKPLAISDIESHLQLARQLMNIGKPYEVDGLGMFSLHKNGGMAFTVGNYAVPLADNTLQPFRLKERTEAQEIHDAVDKSSGIGRQTKNLLIGFLIVILLGLAGWFIWWQYGNANADSSQVGEPIADSTSNLNPDANSAVDALIPTPANAELVDPNVILKWKAYFRIFADKDRALEKLRVYQGTKSPVLLETTDSVNFKMYVVLESSIADTARKTDSLRRFYARPVQLEKINP